MTDLELLSKRLAKVERRFQVMMRGVLVVVILITAAIVVAQVRPQVVPGSDILPDGRIRVETQATSVPIETEVRSRHFVLVDDRGRERASLVADAAGSVFLVMFDSTGKTRANLSVSNDGPSLVFYDPSGRQRTIIGSTTMVASHVNENGIAERAPASSIILFDKSGKLLWREP